MWGHSPACRCGVCLTLHRLCAHIADFTREPGYIAFASDRLRVAAGELCDFIDSRRRDQGAGAASPATGLLPGTGARESQGVQGQGGPGTEQAKEEHAREPERERSSKRSTVEVKNEGEEEDLPDKREESLDQSEKDSHPSTAPKSLPGRRKTERSPLPRREAKKESEEELEESEREFEAELTPHEEKKSGRRPTGEPKKSEREKEEETTPHSEKNQKRRRRTRSRSRRRRRRSPSREGVEREVHHRNPGGASSASKREPKLSQRPTNDPSARLRPRSPSHPPPSGRGGGGYWSGQNYGRGRGYYGGSDWKNKGVKKVETQRSFKAFLAHRKEHLG